MNALRPRTSRMALVAALLALPAPLAAQAPTGGHWHLAQVQSYATPIPPHDCYPASSSGGETSASYSFPTVCMDPPGAFSMTGQWSRPPVLLRPGSKVTLVAQGAIETHDSRLFQGGGVSIEINAARCGYTFLGSGGARVDLTNQDPARMELRQEGAIEVPDSRRRSRRSRWSWTPTPPAACIKEKIGSTVAGSR